MRLVCIESVKKAIELVLKNEVPSGGVLNAKNKLPVELIEIIQRTKDRLDGLSQAESSEQQLRSALTQERARLAAMQNSLSWRITEPLRWLADRFK